MEEVTVTQLPILGSDAVAVVYFTACDLRVHDHDALVAASGAAGVLPVYVFDEMVSSAGDIPDLENAALALGRRHNACSSTKNGVQKQQSCSMLMVQF